MQSLSAVRAPGKLHRVELGVVAGRLLAFLAPPLVELAPGDREGLGLEHPDARAVIRARATVLAAAEVLHRLGLAGEAGAVELAVDDGGHPPAGDVVAPQLEETPGHGYTPAVAGARP